MNRYPIGCVGHQLRNECSTPIFRRTKKNLSWSSLSNWNRCVSLIAHNYDLHHHPTNSENSSQIYYYLSIETQRKVSISEEKRIISGPVWNALDVSDEMWTCSAERKSNSSIRLFSSRQIIAGDNKREKQSARLKTPPLIHGVDCSVFFSSSSLRFWWLWSFSSLLLVFALGWDPHNVYLNWRKTRRSRRRREGNLLPIYFWLWLSLV